MAAEASHLAGNNKENVENHSHTAQDHVLGKSRVRRPSGKRTFDGATQQDYFKQLQATVHHFKDLRSKSKMKGNNPGPLQDSILQKVEENLRKCVWDGSSKSKLSQEDCQKIADDLKRFIAENKSGGKSERAAAGDAPPKPPAKGVSRGERVALRASGQGGATPTLPADPAAAPLSARGRAPPQLHIPVVDDQATHAGPASARELPTSRSGFSLGEDPEEALEKLRAMWGDLARENTAPPDAPPAPPPAPAAAAAAGGEGPPRVPLSPVVTMRPVPTANVPLPDHMRAPAARPPAAGPGGEEVDTNDIQFDFMGDEGCQGDDIVMQDLERECMAALHRKLGGEKEKEKDNERPERKKQGGREKGGGGGGGGIGTRAAAAREDGREAAAAAAAAQKALTKEAELKEELRVAREHLRRAGSDDAASREEHSALLAELRRSQAACADMAAARRSARAALAEMASQNARLVSAFVEKKQQSRRLQAENAELAKQHAEVAKQLEAAEERAGDLGGRLRVSEAARTALEAALKEARAAAPPLAQATAPPHPEVAGVGVGKAEAEAEEKERRWAEERRQFVREKTKFEEERARWMSELETVRATMSSSKHHAHAASSSYAPRPSKPHRPTSPAKAPLHAAGPGGGPMPARDRPAPPRADGVTAGSGVAPPPPPARAAAAAAGAAGAGAGAGEAATPADARRVAEEKKISGNNAFHAKRYEAARSEYTEGIAAGTSDRGLKAVLHCNRAAAYHALHKYVNAVVDASSALLLDPRYTRAMQRRADAFTALGDHAAALKDLHEMARHAPSHDVRIRIADAERRSRAGGQVDHYAVLGLTPSSTGADIKQAYRAMALKHHPDKVEEEMRSVAADLFKLVQGSYSLLSDAEKRKKYDRECVARARYSRSFSYSGGMGFGM